MMKGKKVHKWKVVLCLACCVLGGLSVPASAKTDSPETTQGGRQEEFGVYAKRKETTASEYTAPVQEKKAELIMDGNITLKVENAPEAAATLVVFYIPQTETEAWDWFNGCLEKNKVPALPQHILEVYFLDAGGNRTGADGAGLNVSCTHCGSIPLVCSADTGGNTAVLFEASGAGKQAAFTTNGSPYYILAKKKEVTDNGNNQGGSENTGKDNQTDNSMNGNQSSAATPDGNPPSSDKPGNAPDGNRPTGSRPGSTQNSGNRQNTQQESNPAGGNQPYIEGDSLGNGWENIKNQLETAGEKDTITIAMNGTTVVPGTVFGTIKGKDLTVVFDMGGGISWSVNGRDITADNAKDIDFGVTVGKTAGKAIPVEIINNVTGERFFMNLTLSHDGEFGFRAVLTLNVDRKNAGLFANLFYYNAATAALEYMSAARIDEDGNASLEFVHASDYTIVIDEKDMGAEEATEEPDAMSGNPGTPQETAPADSNNTVLPLAVVLTVAVLLVLTGSVWYALRKKGNKKA